MKFMFRWVPRETDGQTTASTGSSKRLASHVLLIEGATNEGGARHFSGQ
jgi:hypothetical protein